MKFVDKMLIFGLVFTGAWALFIGSVWIIKRAFFDGGMLIFLGLLSWWVARLHTSFCRKLHDGKK